MNYFFIYSTIGLSCVAYASYLLTKYQEQHSFNKNIIVFGYFCIFLLWPVFVYIIFFTEHKGGLK